MLTDRGNSLALNVHPDAEKIAKPETAIRRRQKSTWPLRTSDPRGALTALLNVRIGDDNGHEDNQCDDNRVSQPAKTIAGHRDEQISFDHFTEDKTQDKGRPRPAEQNHKVAEHAEEQSDEQVGDLTVGRVAADKNQQEYERDDQTASDVGQLRQLVEDDKT